GGRWPALVADATWRRVEGQVAGHRHTPHQATVQYLLTALLRCPDCGSRMHGRATGAGSGYIRHRYRCASYARGAATVNQQCRISTTTRGVDAGVLGAVLPVVDLVATSDPALRALIARAWDALRAPPPTDHARRRIQHLEQQASLARRRLAGAAEKFVDGELDKAGYDLLREKAQADLEAATAELERTAPASPAEVLPPLETVLREGGGWGGILGVFDIAAQPGLLAQLVAHPAPTRVGHAKYTVAITWTPLGDALRRTAASALGVRAA